MSFDCEFCLKVYNTVSSLNHHKKTSKKCLKIQAEKGIIVNTVKFSCIYCNKDFLIKSVHEEHEKQCKSKKELYNKDIVEELKKLHDDIKKAEEKHKKEIRIYKDIIKSLTDENKKLKIQVECKSEAYEKLCNDKNKLLKKRIFKDTEELKPITKENLQNEIISSITTKDIRNDYNYFADKLISILSNKIIINDHSRLRCTYITENEIPDKVSCYVFAKRMIVLCKDVLLDLCQKSINDSDETDKEYKMYHNNIYDVKRYIKACEQNTNNTLSNYIANHIKKETKIYLK